LVFILIVLIILILILVITFSKIKIEIVNFRFSSKTNRHTNTDYKIKLGIYILGKIPIFKLTFTKVKLEKMKLKEKVKRLDIPRMRDIEINFDKKLLKLIKHINIKTKKIDLYIELGTENASFTAIIVPIISTVISILLKNTMRDFNNQKFKINPIFTNQNFINIAVLGIFEMKMYHIINIIYFLNKKVRKGVKKHDRTSDRRTYGYSYE